MPQAEPSPGAFPRETIVAASRALGVLGGSHAAPRVLAALCAPGVDAAGVARIVGQEPGLTARVLRVANSAFYGLSRAVATLDRAIVVLGLDAVRGIAAAACLDRRMLRLPDASPVDLDELLRHSVAAATAAATLARRRHRELAGEAFIGGLLHDFGVVVQLHLNPGGVSALAAALRDGPGAGRAELEHGLVGVSHADCAAIVFEAWQLPATLVAAAGHHHDPAAAPPASRPLAALVQLGDHVAAAAGMAFACESAPEPTQRALALLGLEEADLAAAAEGLAGRVADLQRALAAA